MRDLLYLKPVSGLANRLRTIASAVGHARTHGQTLVVLWERDTALNCNFAELFEAPDFRVIDYCAHTPAALLPLVRAVMPTSRRQAASPLHALLRRLMLRQAPPQRLLLCEDLASKLDLGQRFDHYQALETHAAGRIEGLLCAEPGPVFVSSCWKVSTAACDYGFVQPLPPIATRVEALAPQVRDCIGLHIRQGDHGEAIANSPASLFFDIIRSTLSQVPQQRFFVATDAPQVLAALRAEFGDAVLSCEHGPAERNSRAGIESALVELLLLSRTRRLHGSFMSSFAQVAAELGGIAVDVLLRR